MPKTGENIYRRNDGRWEGRIPVVDASGKKKRHSVYGKTYKELKEKMETEKQKEQQRTGKGQKECILATQVAAKEWLSDGKAGWKAGTYAAYRQVVDNYIVPYFGEAPVGQVDGKALEIFVESLKEKEKNLSGTYMSYICGVLQRIIRHTGKKGYPDLNIPTNPVIREKRKRAVPPDGSALVRLEEYLLRNTGEDTGLGILMALHTGIRIGELCALTWQDIDLCNGVLHVRGSIQRVRDFDGLKSKTKLKASTPKTADSIRDIPIPPSLLSILEKRRKNDAEPVISGARGEWMDPRTLQYRFKSMLEKCGVEYFNFHMLRHAFATRCIEFGFDAKTVSELLGHSDVRITLGLYTHSTMQHKKTLMGMMGTYSQKVE